MTQEQKTELEYLIDLLSEASKWNVDQGDDALRLEVELRINNILSSVEVEGETHVTCEPEISQVDNPVDEPLTGADYQALEAAKLNEHLSSKENAKRKWASNRVRVVIDGKHTWKLKSDCHKEVMPGCKTKKHWVWNGPAEHVDKLGDDLWAAHEAGENN